MTTLTIGLPVYNGERFLQESLDALLAQTWTDFELVISDNASTDATADICRDLRGAGQPDSIRPPAGQRRSRPQPQPPGAPGSGPVLQVGLP